LSFVNALERTSIQCFQILSQQPLLHSFYWTTFEALSLSSSDELQLLVIFLLMRCFWRTCFWWRHHFRSTSLQMLQALILLIHLLSFVLSEPYKISKLCLWSCTLEQILAYPINNFKYLVIWWVKPQVHGSTEVVKKVSFRQGVMNSINFQQWLEKSFEL